MKQLFTLLFYIFSVGLVHGQLVLNEGSNKNYMILSDENGDQPDWIELFNGGTDTVHLFNYGLSDNVNELLKWQFPNIKLPPNEFKTVFCSGKNRKPISGFTNVINTSGFVPSNGWNTHPFDTPFVWDGLSNILINVCSYSSAGYTVNSVFNQTSTPFASTSFSFQDGSSAACDHVYSNPVNQRPNLQFNGLTIGSGTIQNSPTDYPAPYGNWYWGARHQILVLASELVAAGLSPGPITSLGFDVVSADPAVYDYISVDMCLVSLSSLANTYEIVDPNQWQHTNFKLNNSGEFVYLSSPVGNVISSLYVDCQSAGISRGRQPDASSNCVLFGIPTPASSNNASAAFQGFLLEPVLSVPSGSYTSTQYVTIDNPNGSGSEVHYTLDGSDPSLSSPIYDSTPIPVFFSSVLKARAFADGILPSEIVASSILLGVDHVTPIISVSTPIENLYGDQGIFTNWSQDWQRQAQVSYLDSNENQRFTSRAAIQVDGGWGGSRYHPQHSFRLELDNSVLGEGPIFDSIIPFRKNRTKFSNFYLRNGSNQFLVFPYKDAFQNQAMSGTTKNYYSAWRPVSVYINGGYFGLYELREKFDAEYFKIHDDADVDSLDILSLSAWYGFVLRSVHGAPVQTFYDRYNEFNLLDQTASDYWELADEYFDLEYYTDYIIAESWMGNQDWPGNNIKIMRSNKTNFRYRFCTIDLELCLQPNGWSSSGDDHIAYLLSQGAANPFINVWSKSIQNNRFRDYFINRFADLMNTEYHTDRLLPLEQYFFDQTVVEMQNEYTRWGNPGDVPGQMNSFYENHLTFRSELSARSENVRQHIKNNFSLPNIVDLQLDVVPEGGGRIHISTIEPDTYPWQGYYFNGVPIRIEAIPNPGYEFLNWGNNPLINNVFDAVFLDTLDINNVTFTAFFEGTSLGLSEEESIEKNVSMYPNPAKDNITIALKKDGATLPLHYEIVDMNGRVRLQGILESQSNQVDIAGLSQGIYSCVLINESGERIGKRLVKF